MYKVEYTTNNIVAFSQALGAVGGITLGWVMTRSPLGGLLGGVLGLAAGTVIGVVIEPVVKSNKKTSTTTKYYRRSQDFLVSQLTH